MADNREVLAMTESKRVAELEAALQAVIDCETGSNSHKCACECDDDGHVDCAATRGAIRVMTALETGVRLNCVPVTDVREEGDYLVGTVGAP